MTSNVKTCANGTTIIANWKIANLVMRMTKMNWNILFALIEFYQFVCRISFFGFFFSYLSSSSSSSNDATLLFFLSTIRRWLCTIFVCLLRLFRIVTTVSHVNVTHMYFVQVISFFFSNAFLFFFYRNEIDVQILWNDWEMWMYVCYNVDPIDL